MAPTEDFGRAREVFEDTYASLHCQTPVKCPLAYRLPAELLRGIHEDLLRRTRSEERVPGFRKVIIAGGRKHYSHTSPDALEVCAVSDLRLGCANIGGSSVALRVWIRPKADVGATHNCPKGKRLDLIIKSAACCTSALHFLAEDKNAWLLPVSVYHASAKIIQLFAEGARISVKEPWLKEGPNGYFVRIDTIADVQWWPPAYSSSRSVKLESTASSRLSEVRKLREEGSQKFGRGNITRAVKSYELGLCLTRTPFADIGTSEGLYLGTEMALLLLNLAAAYLKLGLPGKALSNLSNLKKLSIPYEFTREQHKKIVHRTASAWRSLGRWRELYEYLSSAEVANVVEQDTGLQDTLNYAQDVVEKARVGAYDWLKLYKTAEAKGSIQVAEYQGKIQVTNIPGKGKGVIALEDLPEGSLLVVANPLAYTRVSEETTRLNLGVNLASSSLDSPAQLELISHLLELVEADVPGAIECLADLYAGPGIPRQALDGSADTPQKLRDVCDAGNLEGICTYNAFRPRCITAGLDTEVATEHSEIQSSSALYHLPSMINHSCLGNASFVFFASVLVVRASRRIAAGEEVTFSYCDPTAEFKDRQLHLRRYSFTCNCPLCLSDKSRESSSRTLAARIMASDFQKASHSSASMETLIKSFSGASSQPSVPNYALYRCYRALSACHMKEGRKCEAILASELKALQALGAIVQSSALGKIQERSMTDSLFERKPLFAMQDAIISCLKIASDYADNADLVQARRWFAEAANLHDLEFGPYIFLLRMSGFMADQGWGKLLELDL